MKTHNFHAGRATDLVRGRTGAVVAGVGSQMGSPISRVPNDGELLVYDAATDTLLQVNEFDLLDSGYIKTGVLTPRATITATKSASNPTFAFAAVPENIIRVGATYWAVYMDNVGLTATFNLASATDKNGPWTAYSGNPIYSVASATWLSGTDGMYAPFLLEDAGTFYLFYSGIVSGGATNAKNAVGYATATAVTGTYTDHGSSIFAPSAAGNWDSRRVGEVSILRESNRWVMAYMGESSASTYQTSEKVGIATATTLTGTWTRAAANPVIGFGSGWDALLVADPHLFYANGYYWILYCGSATSNPSVTIQQGLAYSLDPTTAFTRYTGNPILSAGSAGAFDESFAFRGCIWIEDGAYSGIYAGLNGAGTTYRGGNFTLSIDISGIGTGTVTSVGLTVPAEFAIAGSPITGAGTLAITSATEIANTVWAGPASGSAATPAFRALAVADLPAGVVADHEHVTGETHLSDGSSSTYTLDEAFQPGSVEAFNTTTLAYLTVTETDPDQVTVSVAGTAGDKITFSYAGTLA